MSSTLTQGTVGGGGGGVDGRLGKKKVLKVNAKKDKFPSSQKLPFSIL